MLPYVLNIYVTVKFSPKVYRNVTRCCRALEVLGFGCGSSWLMDVCERLELFVHRWCAGPDVVRNVGECCWLFGSDVVRNIGARVLMLLGMSGNVGKRRGTRWLLGPGSDCNKVYAAAPGKFTLRISPPFGTRKDRACWNRHLEKSSVDPVGGNVGVKSVGS